MGGELLTIHNEDTPWERMPDETNKAYAAFSIYLKMPAFKRSLRAAVIEFKGSLISSTLRGFATWSSKYNWVYRAQRWDDYCAAEERRAHVQAIKEMRTRHLKVAQAMFSNGVQRLKAMDADEIKGLSLDEMMLLINKGYTMEREAQGVEQVIEDVVISEQKLTIEESDFSTKTTEELRQLIAHKRHIQFPGTTPAITDELDDTK